MVDSVKIRIPNRLGIVVNFLALIVAIYGLIKDPNVPNIIFLISILIFIVIYFVLLYIITNFLGKLNQIEDNKLLISEIKKDLNNLKDKVDYIKEVARLNVRVSFLEEVLLKMKKNKNGQIDPRWIVLGIIIFLVVLYLWRIRG